MKYANVLVCAGGECLFCFSISRWGAEQIGQVMNFSSHLHFFVVLTRVCVRWGGASLAKCRTGSGEEADHTSFSVRHRPTGARVDWGIYGGAESKCCCALEKIQYRTEGFTGTRCYCFHSWCPPDWPGSSHTSYVMQWRSHTFVFPIKVDLSTDCSWWLLSTDVTSTIKWTPMAAGLVASQHRATNQTQVLKTSPTLLKDLRYQHP